VKTAWVYIMANTHRTIYVGVTTNLERRVWDHKNRAFDGFTKRYGLTKLVYVAEYSRIDDAIVWEKSLKGKTRAKKLALIAEQNPRWNDLAWNWYDEAGNRERPQYSIVILSLPKNPPAKPVRHSGHLSLARQKLPAGKRFARGFFAPLRMTGSGFTWDQHCLPRENAHDDKRSNDLPSIPAHESQSPARPDRV
jgi:putative endonuclease